MALLQSQTQSAYVQDFPLNDLTNHLIVFQFGALHFLFFVPVESIEKNQAYVPVLPLFSLLFLLLFLTLSPVLESEFSHPLQN